MWEIGAEDVLEHSCFSLTIPIAHQQDVHMPNSSPPQCWHMFSIFWIQAASIILFSNISDKQSKFKIGINRMTFLRDDFVRDSYGSRIVPGKKYILSGGRHLIVWRSPLNYVAAATSLCGGRQIIKWRPPDNLTGGRQIKYISYMALSGFRRLWCNGFVYHI